MKLHELKEAALTERRYKMPTEAEPVLARLIREYNAATGKHISVSQKEGNATTYERAMAIVRYGARVMVPESLADDGFDEKAEKMRQLPADVDVNTIRRAAKSVNHLTAEHIADAGEYIEKHKLIDSIAQLVAYRASNAASTTNREAHHIYEMIKICMDIKQDNGS